MTSVLSSKICSWFLLPKKRKQFDSETVEKFNPAKKQRIERAYSSMGWFVTLPVELLHVLFQYLNKESIIILSSLSKDFNSSVLHYILSTPGFTHLLILNKVKNQSLLVNSGSLSDAGKMLGSISGWLSITRRLRIANYCKEKLESMGSECLNTTKCTESFCQLLSSYATNWNDMDKKKVFCLFVKTTKLEQKINNVLRYHPGNLPWHERNLRELLLQTLLLPSLPDVEYGFWLTQILRAYPITNQARLLFILTGPTDPTGSICWHCVCGCLRPPLMPKQDKQYGVSELARTLNILLKRRFDWSMNNIIAIFNDLTTIPCGWCLEKVAELLVKSGKELCKAVMRNKVLNGHTEDISIMFYHLACYCSTNDSTLSCWYIDLLTYTFEQITDKNEKKKLTKSILTSWQLNASPTLPAVLDNQFSVNQTDLHQLALRYSSSITSLIMITNALLDRQLKL